MSRVLLVHEPPDGGVAENVAQLALSLGAEDFEPEVAGPRASAIGWRLRAGGVAVAELPLVRSYGDPRPELAALRALVGLIREGGFDLVHCHSAKAGMLGRIAARRCGVPAIYSPHCYPFVGDVSARRRRLATVAERSLARITATTICACETERRRALERHIAAPERLVTVFYGVPECPAGQAPPAVLGRLAAGGPLVGAVSVLREQKRLDVLLDAIPLVWREVPTARFVLIGNGPLREALAQQARALGLSDDDRFAMLDFEPPSASYLRSLDVFVLPSAWEAMPIGVLEALACGVPQVVTEVEGTGEATDRETGRLVASGEPGALAAALSELLGDPGLREQLSSASRARHAERFGLQRMVAETAAVYRRAIGANR